MQKIYAIVLIALEIDMTIKQLEKEIKENLSQLNKEELIEILNKIRRMICH